VRCQLGSLLASGILLCARAAGAEEPPAPKAEGSDDPSVLEARREFLRGAELVKAERWGDALDAFERANGSKAHAVTTFNIGQCERATGQYTRAKKDLALALAQDLRAEKSELTETSRAEARALIAEIDRILARASVVLAPGDSVVSVDGRPLEPFEDEAGATVLVAGTAAPGPGRKPGSASFVVVMNPGAHVFTVSHQGWKDVVVNRTFAPASQTSLSLELDRLPATLHVTSTLADAVVRVNDADVGNPPVEVSRNAGTYRVRVTRKGYVPYETDVVAHPGERVEIPATLRDEKRALTQQWWFWTAAGALVIGAATTTYFLTRPEPTRPAPEAGGLGWSLKVP
jgi:hypothetical protein